MAESKRGKTMKVVKIQNKNSYSYWVAGSYSRYCVLLGQSLAQYNPKG